MSGWIQATMQQNTIEFCTFEIASFVNVLGHYLRKYSIWLDLVPRKIAEVKLIKIVGPLCNK